MALIILKRKPANKNFYFYSLKTEAGKSKEVTQNQKCSIQRMKYTFFKKKCGSINNDAVAFLLKLPFEDSFLLILWLIHK